MRNLPESEFNWPEEHRDGFAYEMRTAISSIKKETLGLEKWFSYNEVEVQVIGIEGYGSLPITFYVGLPTENDMIPLGRVEQIGGWLYVTVRETIESTRFLPTNQAYGFVFIPNGMGMFMPVTKIQKTIT